MKKKSKKLNSHQKWVEKQMNVICGPTKKSIAKKLKSAGTKALVAAGISKKFITSHVVFM